MTKIAHTSAPSYNYEIHRDPANVGGGRRVRFFRNGTDVGMAVFRAHADADPRAGLDWWNGITEVVRAQWLVEANSAEPRDAWAVYLRQSAFEDAFNEALSWLELRERL